jgi:hypothetical protein
MRQLLAILAMGMTACVATPDEPASEQALAATTNGVNCWLDYTCDAICPFNALTNTVHQVCYDENGQFVSDEIISAHRCGEECY